LSYPETEGQQTWLFLAI